jgi:hypothetical protein
VPDADEPELGDDDTESDDDAEAVEAGDGDETART